MMECKYIGPGLCFTHVQPSHRLKQVWLSGKAMGIYYHGLIYIEQW